MSLNVKDYKTLSVEYVLAHGVNKSKLTNFAEGSLYVPGRGCRPLLYRVAPDGSKTPFTGVLYEPSSGILWNNSVNIYTVYKDGIGQYSGSYSRKYRGVVSEYHEFAPFKQVFFYKDGSVKSIDNSRPDCHYFREIVEFDENGRVTERKVNGEMELTHVPGSPDSRYELKFYSDTGYFKSIRIKEPTKNDFYSYVEYDREHVPTKAEINPGFAPDRFALDPENNLYFKHAKTINDAFRVRDGELEYSMKLDHGFDDGEPHFSKYTGAVKYFREDGSVRSVYCYDGTRCGNQYEYYPNGHIKEFYYISGIKDMCSAPLDTTHLRWDEDGRLAEATVYAYDYSGKKIRHWKR